MAHLIQVNESRSESERRALSALAGKLPASWIITTNIKEHNFEGLRRRPEIDSVVICPLGIFLLDFKNFSGSIVPMMNRDWGAAPAIGNPFEQATNNCYAFRDLLKKNDEELQQLWLEWLIVMTHSEATLDWNASDLREDQKIRIPLLIEVETAIRKISRSKLSVQNARSVLKALHPSSIPDGLFETDEWATIPTPSTGSRATSGNKSQTDGTDASAKENVQRESLVDSLFPNDDWPNRYYFSVYLRAGERPELTSKTKHSVLSDDELTFLHNAKNDFCHRKALAKELLSALRSVNIDRFMGLDDGFLGIRGMLSSHRISQIFEQYVHLIFMEGDVSELSAIIVACRAFTNTLATEEFKMHLKIGEELKGEFRTLRLRLDGTAVERYQFEKYEGLGDLVDEDCDRLERSVRQRIRNERNWQENFFLDLIPKAPWSSNARAAAVIRKLRAWLRASVRVRIFSSLAEMSRIIGLRMSKDLELKRRISREALTGSAY
jgi:hypothetical protein